MQTTIINTNDPPLLGMATCIGSNCMELFTLRYLAGNIIDHCILPQAKRTFNQSNLYVGIAVKSEVLKKINYRKQWGNKKSTKHMNLGAWYPIKSNQINHNLMVIVVVFLLQHEWREDEMIRAINVSYSWKSTHLLYNLTIVVHIEVLCVEILRFLKITAGLWQ